ncbi:hypothetical protein ACI65C_006393 [Semiaphis heraclei]
MKSVSTPGSHKSPFRRSVQSIDLHENMLPKDLTYYKLIKMSDNRDYIVGSYSYILPSAQHSDILAGLYFRDFDTLSGEINTNHWIVVVINFKTKMCYVMDPFNPYDTESPSSKLHFKHVSEMLKSNLRIENLKQSST